MNAIQPEGNYYNKYQDNGLIIKAIMKGYFKQLDCMLNSIAFETVYEAGCGEGHVSQHVYSYNLQKQLKVHVTASDISDNVIGKAKVDFPHIRFKVESIFNLDEEENSYGLVIASEVLEHLDNPEKALKELFRISNQYVYISVPNEPIWRIANFMRGKYIYSLGNTPGHINHWTKREIMQLVRCYGNILEVTTPFPWTMILSEKKQ